MSEPRIHGPSEPSAPRIPSLRPGPATPGRCAPGDAEATAGPGESVQLSARATAPHATSSPLEANAPATSAGKTHFAQPSAGPEVQKQPVPASAGPEVQKQPVPASAGPEVQKQPIPASAGPEVQKQPVPASAGPEVQKQPIPASAGPEVQKQPVPASAGPDAAPASAERSFRDATSPALPSPSIAAPLLAPSSGPLRPADDEFILRGDNGEGTVVGLPTAQPADAGLQADLDRLTATTVTQGNSVDILIDGQAALPAFLDALGSAKENITYQTYIFRNDPAGNEVADKLIEKAAQGVNVRVVVDSLGSRDLPLHHNALLKRMRENGVDVLVYNPVGLHKEVVHRDHRKAVVVDGGRVAFLGGMNTAEPFLGHTGEPAEFHDVFLRLQGPAAHDIQDIFCRTWRDAGGTLLKSDMDELHGNMQVASETGVPVRVINHVPGRDVHIRDAYLRLIREAKNHIYLENSYPLDSPVREALIDAAKRGVDVRYIYGGHSIPDPLQLVAEHKFPQLLEAGVKIYRHPQYCHTKSLSVDGRHASIGSSNFDNFSLKTNREAVAIVSDPAWVSRYEQELFQVDVQKSMPIPADMDAPFWKPNIHRTILDAVWPDSMQ